MNEIDLVWLVVDSQVEGKFKKEGIPFEDSGLVNRKRMVKPSQPRIDKRIVDREMVDKLKLVIKDGEALLPLVVHRSGKNEVIDQGIHRITAIDELIKEGRLSEKVGIRRYLLLTDDEFALDVARTLLNDMHGRGLLWDEKKAAAYEMLLKYPFKTISEVAGRFHMSETALRNHKDDEDLRKLCIGEGILDAAGLNATVLRKLGPLKGDKSVFVEAVRVAAKCGLTSGEADGLSQIVRRERSESSRIEAVLNFERSRPKPPVVRSSRKSNSSTVWQRLDVIIRNLSSMIDRYPTISHWGVTSKEDKQACENSIEEIIRKLEGTL